VSLFDAIILEYPELTKEHFAIGGIIELQDDSDDCGAYIKRWDYDKPIPNGLKLGK
jgi:hypothetical protein